jgi:hypothetical protein
MIIFTYAPAGLGHLRVTDALYHGLPEDISPLLLSSLDKWIVNLHRFTSINTLARAIFESTQEGILEDLFTLSYRFFLRTNTKNIYQQMVTIIDQRIEKPKTLLVVATHFGLAHQIAAIKDIVMKDRDVRIVLVVQVTDDSPQHIWYVPGADLTFVPSKKTKEKLIEYGKEANLPEVRFEVNPYPIGPAFCEDLSDDYCTDKRNQLKADSKSNIHIAVPISGAAVGTEYLKRLIEALHHVSQRFVFHVIAKKAPYTSKFLEKISLLPYVKLHIANDDRDAIDEYDKLYQSNIISLEITKPSEQAFKALVEPDKRGGPIILFSKPVGRQEYDNLDFLRRHQLIPKYTDQKILWDKAAKGSTLTPEQKHYFAKEAKSWRGLILPQNPNHATQFIHWCISENILEAMTHFNLDSLTRLDAQYKHEVLPHGVQEFWRKLSELLVQLPQ